MLNRGGGPGLGAFKEVEKTRKGKGAAKRGDQFFLNFG